MIGRAGLMGYGHHHGKKVFCTMIDLAHQKLDMSFAIFLFGNIKICADHPLGFSIEACSRCFHRTNVTNFAPVTSQDTELTSACAALAESFL